MKLLSIFLPLLLLFSTPVFGLSLDLNCNNLDEDIKGPRIVFQDTKLNKLLYVGEYGVSVTVNDATRHGKYELELVDKNGAIHTTHTGLLQDVRVGSSSAAFVIAITSAASTAVSNNTDGFIKADVAVAEFETGKVSLKVFGKLSSVSAQTAGNTHRDSCYQASYSGNGVYELEVPFDVNP